MSVETTPALDKTKDTLIYVKDKEKLIVKGPTLSQKFDLEHPDILYLFLQDETLIKIEYLYHSDIQGWGIQVVRSGLKLSYTKINIRFEEGFDENSLPLDSEILILKGKIEDHLWMGSYEYSLKTEMNQRLLTFAEASENWEYFTRKVPKPAR